MSQLLQLRQLLQLFVMKTSVPGKYLMRIIFLLILKLQLKILSRRAQGNLLDGDEGPKQSEIQGPSSEKDTIQINLRMRAATATALGAAAAHAKYLADQEERRMEQLMAIMIETQMKKLKRKMKYFDELELIMEKENAHIEELEESLVADRLNVLQRIFNAGISRWKDHASVKSETGSVQ
ncbi:SWI SNF complex subunit SWI3A [Olea europaea subsp. europaea]|uniref:SWI SNF complex subunit SWI3A n=1 Tax=Olea europaea subsp. europaea TaxID=158383 RepID=A0A8S0VPI6_OLEEU|nr:SWI SNF complex subunit SWI3A [Olea europaea subsp. europaea]